MVMTVALVLLSDSRIDSFELQRRTIAERPTTPSHGFTRDMYRTEIMFNISTMKPILWVYRHSDGAYFPIFTGHSSFAVSHHVAFSVEEPVRPPWDWNSNMDEIQFKDLDETSEFYHLRPIYVSKENIRMRRRVRSESLRHSLSESYPKSTCGSFPYWTTLRRAEIVSGENVTVVETFPVGGRRVHQYFYVTKCAKDKSPCFGIDTHRFNSVCANTRLWVKARIINNGGHEDWSYIAIDGSCTCRLTEKRRNELHI